VQRQPVNGSLTSWSTVRSQAGGLPPREGLGLLALCAAVALLAGGRVLACRDV
jgi:hypothetical protein